MAMLWLQPAEAPLRGEPFTFGRKKAAPTAALC